MNNNSEKTIETISQDTTSSSLETLNDSQPYKREKNQELKSRGVAGSSKNSSLVIATMQIETIKLYRQLTIVFRLSNTYSKTCGQRFCNMRKYCFDLCCFSFRFSFFLSFSIVKKEYLSFERISIFSGATRLFLTHGSYIKLSFSTYWPTYVASNVPYKIPYSDKMTNVRLRFYSTMLCHFIERRYRPSPRVT